VRSICGGRSEGRSAPVTSRYNDRSVCDVLRTGSYDRTIRTFERTLTRRYCVPSVVCIRIVREPLTQKTNDPGEASSLGHRETRSTERKDAIVEIGLSAREESRRSDYASIFAYEFSAIPDATRDARGIPVCGENFRKISDGHVSLGGFPGRSHLCRKSTPRDRARVRASIHSQRRFNAARRSPREIRSRE